MLPDSKTQPAVADLPGSVALDGDTAADLVYDTRHDLFGYAQAMFSRDGKYRYLLTRRWALTGTHCVWLMLNPSTATASEDDNTVNRITGYSRRWGHAGLVVVNLFAVRSTDPKLLATIPDPVGPVNDTIIRQVCRPGTQIIAAWGAHGTRFGRAAQVVKMLDGVDLSCLGVTGNGQPKHPLYCPLGLMPKPYLSDAS